jgi:nitric oxide dioxygenase
MLSETSTATVRATLPAVGGAVGEISSLFYDKLFAAHPELLRDLFNRGNQANGSQQQALAGAIAAFATALVEHPDVRPDAMLARIAHKHVSLGISAEQYPVVHHHLFEAIAEVLGAAVTPEVAAAWDEVYWLMANALIAIEARLREEAGLAEGEVWADYRVTGRRQETEEVVTFTVSRADGAPVPAFRPGQYVSVQVELPDGGRQIRQYSLVGRLDGGLAFSVKRIAAAGADPAGEVSNHLHDTAHEGTALRISAPAGDVYLDETSDRPLLLVSAGIGCTPMIGILSHLADRGTTRRVVSLHADRSPHTHAFRADLDQLTAKLADADAQVWYEQPQSEWPAERTGRADLTAVGVPSDAVAYLCGPLPFLRAARGQLLELGVPAADIHYEVFGPDLWLGQD